MAVAGRKPKPYLQAVREGTFREDRHTSGVRFAPAAPVEPDWEDVLPGRTREVREVRRKAAEVWANVVPALVHSAGLTDTQRETAVEYCVTVARLWQAERALSTQGVVVKTERGYVKNPWVTVANQYRSHFRSLTAELGLSPSAAARIQPPADGGENDDVFD